MNEQWNELKETIIELRDNNGTGTQQEVCAFLANLMGVLEKQMSSSENPNRWIPVSERLPEKTGKYIVTVGINRFGWGMFDEVSVATYNIRTGWFVRDDKDTVIGDVTAWMPLPEPYEEVEE